MSQGNEKDVVLTGRMDPKTGQTVAEAVLTPESDGRDKTVLLKVPAVIPIVFLPGIMGSNLKTKGTDDPAWRPPNAELSFAGIGEVISSLATWGFRGAKKRQEILSPDNVELDIEGPIDVADSGLSKDLAYKRGWGGVMKGSYHPFMADLQVKLNNILKRDKAEPWWGTYGMHAPKQYGDESGALPSLSDKHRRHAANYTYDVWAGGYRWPQSNRESAAEIRTYIDDVVLAHYRKLGVPAEKVILVTHSMGGLVSRALTEIHKYDKVLGVIHGVQPSLGAPTIYHHMRCGYEGPSQLILGRNAAQVTAVVANAPGALELLPTRDYDGGKPWLMVRKDKNAEPVLGFPAKGDAYNEIYMSPEWYGLVPQHNSSYLDFKHSPKIAVDIRAKFIRNIASVQAFHLEIERKYHPQTYAHYGAEGARGSFVTIVWQGDPAQLAPNATPVFHDDGNGDYVATVAAGRSAHRIKGMSFQPATGAGDGTVSYLSGEAPGKASVKGSFKHGNPDGKESAEPKGYDHQESYLDERSKWAALYGIVMIAQDADWHA